MWPTSPCMSCPSLPWLRVLLSLAYSVLAARAFLLLRCAKHSPATGPLYLVFRLPGVHGLFPHIPLAFALMPFPREAFPDHSVENGLPHPTPAPRLRSVFLHGGW